MLKNFWYALVPAHEVTSQPRRIRALGQDLVAYRTHDGQPIVMSNLCVHRGGSLADGSVEQDCVRCPYHGWRFGPSGACIEIPAAPHARVVENGVDIAHTPFVHRHSFGNVAEPRIQDYRVTRTEYSVATTVQFLPPLPRGLWKLVRRRREPVTASVAVYMPNVTRLDLDFGRWRTVIFDCNLPVDESTTRTLWIQARNFLTWRWADRDARRRVHAIFLEDQPIVETQRPELLPYDLAAELHVKSDAIGVAYRQLRNQFLERGWGIDMHAIASEGRHAVVIPSPARREIPEMWRAWVIPEVPTRDLGTH